jgi:two-component system chemotaxis response regulator CheY
MRLILARILTRLGFEVAEAGDGREALDRLTADGNDINLVLIDWNMPVMNGLELVTAVRADEHLRHVTLVMVTTEGEQSKIARALAAGAHEYVIKPFTPEAIAEKLALLGLSPDHVPAPA